MTTRQPLLDALLAAHLRLGLATVIAAGLILTAVSFLTLRTYVEQNLTLVARSISYTAEAATVFGDGVAAQEALTLIAVREQLQSARIVGPRGFAFAAYHAYGNSPFDASLSQVAAWLFSPQASAPIVHDGRQYGRVIVQGNGGVYLSFLLKVLATIGLCTAAMAWGVARLSLRVEHDIVKPLNHLAALTRRARTERALALRAAPAAVKEIHELGEDVNALLAEIQSREAQLVAKHDTLRTANESLSYLAFHDSLTGLPNRSSFLERAAKAVQAQRAQGDKVAVLYLDCDHFKAVNDGLGHAAGDELLVELAQRLRSLLRETDFVARIGGDEFAVLLTPIHAIDDAARIAAKVAAAIGVPIASAAFGAVASSASIGVAVFPDHGADVDALLAAADAAMYRAKAQRPGSVAVFDAGVDDVTSPMVA